MRSSSFLKTLLPYFLFTLAGCDQPVQPTIENKTGTETQKPNIIYILADDLGYGEIGPYGQTKITTPSLDVMARQGMMFTQHYSGSTVCAPSRSSLMTGQDTGRTIVRGNKRSGEGYGSGQYNLPADTTTIGTMLQENGYKTAIIGKWGLGSLDGPGHPNKMGFDYFYGYLDQRAAHNYYPQFLWRNEDQVLLNNPNMPRPYSFEGDPNDLRNYAKYKGPDYASDLMGEEVEKFILDNKDDPFFIYYALTVPHAALQVPDEELIPYEGKFEEEPYLAKDRGYFPHIKPRSAHAAQISRMDRRIGRIIDLLQELKLDKNTMVIFTSDNGPAAVGGLDPDFFDASGIYRGIKRDLYEGGIRVPMIVRWPGKVEENSSSEHVSAFWDVMATLSDLSSGEMSNDSPGISFLPTLIGEGVQKNHDSLYWEFHERGGKQAVRMGKWKGIRLNVKENSLGPIELYDLENDPSEEVDISQYYPDIVDEIAAIMSQRSISDVEDWNFN